MADKEYIGLARITQIFQLIKSKLPTKTSDLQNDSGFITGVDMDDIGDVNLTSLSNGQILKYNSTSHKWENANESGGGSTYTEGDGIDISNDEISVDTTFTDASTRTNIASGDSFGTILGKIKKFFTDLKTVAFSGSYNDLTDKPTIPTVNNATLTIQKNGSTVNTFTANASSNVTANITVPTKVSELTNDSGFVTTDTKVTQTVTTTSADYEVLFSATADNTTRTEGARKNNNLLFNPSTGELGANGYRRRNITGATLDLDTLTLSTGAPHIVYYICKTTGGSDNISNKPVASSPFILDVEAIRSNGTSDYITRQTFRNAANSAYEYVRFCTNGTWSAWTTRKFTDTWTAMVGATSSANGSVGYVNATPPKDGYNTKFLRADGTWSVPAYPTIPGVVSTSANGLAPKVTDTSKFLKGDGTWATPTDTNNRKAFYGTCATAAGTAAKVVTLSNTDGWELKAGTIVGVKFTNSNTASSCTLNVNSSGAKSIYYNNAAYTGSSTTVCGEASKVLYYMYDGTYWVWAGLSWIYTDGNTYDRNRYNANIKCGSTAITAGRIIVGDNGTYQHLSTSSFDISYPILYAASNIAANATGTNNYDIINFTITSTKSITLTAYKPVYIKGDLDGNRFDPGYDDLTELTLTQTLPSSDDGYCYLLLGVATSTTAVYLTESHPIFARRNGTFGEIVHHALLANSANSATTATTASKLGSSTVGGANQPIYLNAGTAKACNTFVPNTGGTFDAAGGAAGGDESWTTITLGNATGRATAKHSNGRLRLYRSASATATTSYYTELRAGANTAPRTITFPNATGTVALKELNNSFTANQTIDKASGTAGGSEVWSTLVLGNATGRATAKHSNGDIYLYRSASASATTAYYTRIIPGGNTANRTLTLPNATGTVALTTDAVKVKQTNSNDDANYRLLMSASASDSELTEQVKKSSKLLYNPLAGKISITQNSAEPMFEATRSDTGVTVRFGVGVSGINHGIYSEKLGGWLIYGTNTEVHIQGAIADGRILTSAFANHGEVVNGAYAANSHTIPNLLDELRYSSGCMGSVSITTQFSGSNAIIPVGWYNYLWIPHRTGGLDGAAYGDNTDYGQLLLFSMETPSKGYFDITYNSGTATSCVELISSLDMRTWLPSNGFDPLSGSDKGIFAYSINPGLLPSQGIPTGLTTYGTLFGLRYPQYKVMLYVSVLGELSIWSTNQNKWVIH